MAATAPAFAIKSRDAGEVMVVVGDWRIDTPVADSRVLAGAVGDQVSRSLGFDCSGLGEWDSRFVVAVRACQATCRERGLAFDPAGLPEGVRQLLLIADAVRPRVAAKSPGRGGLRAALAPVHAVLAEILSICEFAGELVIALARLLAGRARTRMIDFLWFVQQGGPRAIGIVTLISVLVGMILAYLGSVQLRQLGAQVYVAHLVGLGMVREMGALMTGVIMAGRTGAAYAAQLGTMQTREEIDAIETLGIPPMEFLVLPRVLALVFVMPLLCIYSDVLGMVGGGIVALAMDVTWAQYQNGLREAVDLGHIATGVAKSIAFGALIAAAGCRAGMRCGRSSEAVGQATTTAVVKSIVYLVVADAAFNITYQRLGI